MTDQISAEEVNGIDDDATALILTIMQQNTKNSASAFEQLMYGYRREAALARAEIDAIRWRVRKLYNSGFMPTESSVIEALWPNTVEIEEFLEEEFDD